MLSVVIPVFDEQDVLPVLADRLRRALDDVGEPYEVVFVNDGSRDASGAVLEDVAAGWPAVRIRHLARNVGHQLALTAGLDVARGDWVVTMDADLQDPPELIGELLDTARAEDVDIVYARRTDRTSDSAFKRRTANVYYRLMRRTTGVAPPAHVGDFRLLSARVVRALHALPERHRVYRILIPWLGFRSTVVDYRRDARAAGTTKYSFRRMALLAADSLVSFSAAPLRVATGLGLVSAAVCLVFAVVATITALAGNTVPGWASITVGMLFLGAVQLICVGALGEYVGRIFEEVQRRPLYVVDSDTGEPAVDLAPDARVTALPVNPPSRPA